MQTHLYNALSLSFQFLFLLSSTCVATAARMTPPDLVRSSCSKARYPNLCIQTLSNYAGPTTKPLDLAKGAVKVSLAHARTLSAYFKTLQVQLTTNSNNRQRVALKDCVEQISDSVAELNRTLNELQHLRLRTFEWQISNAQTWASAALTNGDSCIDGFNDAAADGKMKLDVKLRVHDVAMLTSNALYLINRLADRTTHKPSINSNN